MITKIFIGFQKNKKTVASDSEDDSNILQIYYPHIVSYTTTGLAFLFLLFACISWLGDIKIISIISLTIAIMCLSSLPTLCSMVFVGRKFLIKRTSFLVSKEMTYDLRDISEIFITSRQKVKICFKNNTTLSLPAYNKHFLNLPKHQSDKVIRPEVDGLYRLKDELLRRKDLAPESADSFEIQTIKHLPYLGFSFIKTAKSFAIVLILIGGGSLIYKGNCYIQKDKGCYGEAKEK